MAYLVGERIAESSTSTGTGAFALTAALPGYQRFSAICSVSDTLHYMIVGDDGSWEQGLGTYSAANTLTRTTVQASTNAGAAVTFPAGNKQVFLSFPGMARATTGSASKGTPVDADVLPLVDSAAPNVNGTLVNLSWANAKATLKNYFDSVVTTLTNKTLTSPVLTSPTIDSVNGGQLAGRRNRVINGGMSISQRGSVTLPNGSYTYGGADRMVSYLAATTVSCSVAQANQGAAYPTLQSGYSHAFGNITTTGATTLGFGSRLEQSTVADMNGRKVTASMMVWQDSGSTQTCSMGIYTPTSLDNWSGNTGIFSSATNVPTATWTKVVLTATLGATDANAGLMVAAFYTLPALTNRTFYFADLQFEIAPAPTPLEIYARSEELAACQRYYETIQNDVISYTTSAGNTVLNRVKFATAKRAAPSISQLTNNSSFTQNNVTATTSSVLAVSTEGVSMYRSASAVGLCQWSETLAASAEI